MFLLIVIVVVVYFYTLPRSFDKIVSWEEQHSIIEMHAYGNLPNGESEMTIPIDKIQEILEVLNSYQYRRCIDENTGGQGVSLSWATKGYRWAPIMQVWTRGYISIPNYERYKVLNNDDIKLLDRITEIIEY